ncbi:solute carrier family 66 member 2 isoform X2 [Venturia canescens]|uniref:solute carrier family 66 member 2 isoform X2 n=1 Tax=Venturia canescens TaxID=32260 RepID=UPI001C9CB0BA|nr:solute carrier family 66 member 2 isoform X2 [Venturia canescens]
MNFTYEEVTITDVIGWIAVAVMVVGGVVPYIPQYREIRQKEDTDGFSLYVCLALLIANTLRIIFWFGKFYEIPLLLQSILMNLTMLLMVKLCVDIRNKNQIIKSKRRVFTDFQSYLEFLLLFGVLSGILMYIFSNNVIFVEGVGMMAALTEAMLGVPQFLWNLRNKSTKGMSLAMVMMWMVGDTFKTCYFIQRQAPLQFRICGALQVIIDVLILVQVYIYRKNPPPVLTLARTD